MLTNIPYPWSLPGRVHGIDVSHAQADKKHISILPWRDIAAFGCLFASIKLSEGNFHDLSAESQLDGARSVGLRTGSYHFFHSSEDPVVQATNYSSQYNRLGPFTERPVIDWEDDWRVRACGPQLALHNVLDTLSLVHRLTGRRPNVYTGPGFMAPFRGLDLSQLLQYDLWVAHYRWGTDGHDYGLTKPTIPGPWKVADAWQCGGDGAPRIPGVPVNLDRDIFFGEESAYLKWCEDKPTPEPGLQMGDGGVANDSYYVDRAESELEKTEVEEDNTPTKPQSPRSLSKSGRYKAIIDGDEKKK